MTGKRGESLRVGDPVPGGSVFLQALGDEARKLHPEVLKYVAGAGSVGSTVLVEGEFTVAGSRYGRLNLLARPFVGPDLFVTRYERDVPFRVENTIAQERDAGLGLKSERVFMFRSGPQRFVDVLLPSPRPGRLRNRVGASRRVELELSCSVTESGFLRLSSERAWLLLGPLRIRLPTFASVRAAVIDGFDDEAQRNTVRAEVRNPVLGTVLEYRGTFSREIV
ncbi:uncharacterized protein DUF4166 [Mycolicibacterium mucogenicum 261Sha1.1M5]|nr:uncharacterized protein DUF4166 [Mycolicibacterium mucogenicum 261Sha1.1M5]